MIDLHSHILPQMDDGPQSVNQSIGMLTAMKNYGCDTVAATSHYSFFNEEIEEFLEKRDTMAEHLRQAIKKEGMDVPQIILGAEVLFFQGMSKYKGIEKLCYEHSNYLLVELPYVKWDTGVFRELQNINIEMGLVPVLAHVERYKGYGNTFGSVEQYPFLMQINAETLTRFGGNIWINKIKKNKNIVLGSDCHDRKMRPPNLDRAFCRIEKKLGTKTVERIDSMAQMILQI